MVTHLVATVSTEDLKRASKQESYLFHCNPLDTFMFVDVFDQALMHEQSMRTTRSIRVDGHGEDELVVLPVEVIEMISPDIFEIPAYC